ncbi:dihydrofolate reductase family protein [Cellulosimicrobium composti]|nr:dihydrofolate reductase family protein [Cellulosimicrobium composti]
MSYWEDPEAQATFDEADRTWAELWKALPKVVFSRTLTDVTGTNTRLATGTVADEIARLRAEPGDGEIAIGGAMLAAEAARHDLIDEYRAIVHPVLVGGGLPFFPQEARRVDLRLVEARTIVDTVVLLRYRVQR